MAGERAPGWYPDESTPGVERWWDGQRWTGATRPLDATTASTRGTFFSALRRHRVLTAVSGTVALVVVLAVIGATIGNDGAAVAAVVEDAQVTQTDIAETSASLAETLAEAKTLAAEIGQEATDLPHHADLMRAIDSAEAVTSRTAVLATTEMSLEEAQAAHDGAVALLAELSAAQGPLREAMEAASQSHEVYLAAALDEARSAHAAAQSALAEAVAAAEQALAESESAVGDEVSRTALRAALDEAQAAVSAAPGEDHRSFEAATTAIAGAERGLRNETAAVTAAVAKAEADRLAAEQAAAAQAAAERAAAEQAAAEQAEAEQERAAAQQPPAGGSDGGSTTYRNCSEVRAAGKAPLYRDDPGYAPKLDRDNDGVACE